MRKKSNYLITLFVSIMLISGSGTEYTVHSMIMETTPEVEKIEEEKKKEEAKINVETQSKLSDTTVTANESGLLSMKMANDIPFNPGNKGGSEEVNILFKPRVDSNASRSLVITGLRASGISAKKPIIKLPITSAEISPDKDKLTINFDPTFTVGQDIDFRFSIEVSDEKSFSTKLQKVQGSLPKMKSLEVIEYVNGKSDQRIFSDMEVNYAMTGADLLTNRRENYTNASGAFRDGMTLYTEAKNIDGNNYDGSGWQKKESEYYLRPMDASIGGNHYTYISPRFIQNMRIEIPLPPNVTFVSSEYETGKNGLKISGSLDKTYVILEYDEYNSNSEIKFTMTLDYTKLSTTGGTAEYGINDWHNFWSNKTAVPERNQTDKPWKFTGEMYGVSQTKQFYDRSALVLDTSIAHSNDSELNGNYKYSRKIVDKQIGKSIEFDGIPNNILRNDLDKFDHSYTRKGTFEFDEVFRIKSVNFEYDNNLKGDIAFTFYTNQGNSYTEMKSSNSSNEKIKVLNVSEGEFINKITVEATGNRYGTFYFITDILDVDINGAPLKQNKESKIKLFWDIPGFGAIRPKNNHVNIATATYVEPVVAAPTIDRKMLNTYSKKSNKFLTNFTYKDINLLTIQNTALESGNTVNRDLTDIKIDFANTTIKDAVLDEESIPVYQMMTKGTSTLQLTNYNDSNLPTIKIIYLTSSNNKGEISIDKSKFTLVNGNASMKVNFNLPNGEVIKALAFEISSLPSGAKINLTLDEFHIREDTLPSGRIVNTLPMSKDVNALDGYPASNTNETKWNFDKSVVKYKTPSGSEKSMLVDNYNVSMELAWNLGTNFSWIYADYLNSKVQRPAILPGDSTSVELALSDTAFNPTYGIEIDKNFNYIPGSFKGIGKEYRFVEEWVPNYFNDPDDTAHYGNGLLRIRFIGSGSDAFNLFPINNYERYFFNEGVGANQFQFDLYAKFDAKKDTHKLIKKMYRSDKWALKNLVGKQLNAVGWDELKEALPESTKHSPITVHDGIEGQRLTNDSTSEKDVYDMDGDGDTTHYILSSEVRGSIADSQQITEQTTTNVKTYLVDQKTGAEIRDVDLLPHQEVGFVQAMQLVSANSGSNFIGYYHIPKKGHTITFVDDHGVNQSEISEFDTYLTNFITTSVDGNPIPVDKGMIIYYYISPNPSDPTSDDHNAMAELNGGNDSLLNYKTEDEVKEMALDQSKTVKEILANCTMIKFKADVIEVNKKIVSKTTLAMGHKEGGDKKSLKGYFSGKYKYTSNGNTLPISHTPLTTFTMNPYEISGTIFHDKDANSLMSPLELRKKGIAVELWVTGNDPHTGKPVEDKLIESVNTDEFGEYRFTINTDGDFYVEFKLPDGQVLSLKDKHDGYPDERSTFVVDQNENTIAKSSFTIVNTNYPFQNAGLVDERKLKVPEHMYISVGETRLLPYQITPDYVMSEHDYKILPTITSNSTNDTFFTVDNSQLSLKGLKEGVKTITVSIPNAPLDGSVITQDVIIHVEPATVASITVPTKVEIYATQGKDDEIKAPNLHISNYSPEHMIAYIRGIELQNTGVEKDLQLVERKSDSNTYAVNEISLNVIPLKSADPSNTFIETDVTKIEDINGGLRLGRLPAFQDRNDIQFTFNGKYNRNIIDTKPEDNRFVMSYRFVQEVSP